MNLRRLDATPHRNAHVLGLAAGYRDTPEDVAFAGSASDEHQIALVGSPRQRLVARAVSPGRSAEHLASLTAVSRNNAQIAEGPGTLRYQVSKLFAIGRDCE